MVARADAAKDDGVLTRKVTRDEAAYILGRDGRTKAKLTVVSGATIDLAEDSAAGSQLHIRGTEQQRRCAMKYVEFVIAQRLGPVEISDPESHDDLTILGVPAETVSFVTGKGGSFLRLVEEEWGTLLFFLQVDPANPPRSVDPTQTERLAIFGPERARCGAMLKVMACIEMKQTGYFTRTVPEHESPDEGFATDTVHIKQEDYSYALGKNASIRKKLAKASSCIVEYVGNVAYLCGTKRERARAKEYLCWLLRQRAGQQLQVAHQGRDDVTVMMLPGNVVGLVTGQRGSFLHAIEEKTSTFCFIEPGGPAQEWRTVLIFGCSEDRRLAEQLLMEKVMEKQEEDLAAPLDDPGSDGWRRARSSKGWAKGSSRRSGTLEPMPGGLNGLDTAAAGTEAERPAPGVASEAVAITEDSAATLMGLGGKMKKRIAAASGATLDLRGGRLEVAGTGEERARAKKYIQLLSMQRLGSVRLDNAGQHSDLSLVEVPAQVVQFVTGRHGAFLKSVEEEFEVMLFTVELHAYGGAPGRAGGPQSLGIFGSLRERRGAELKVMAVIESKLPGYFTERDGALPPEDESEGFATDFMPIDEEDYSYALGKGGATRKRIARASGCVIGYVGHLAYLSGTKRERMRAREYLCWLFQQRVGPVEVDYACRDDVTALQVPKAALGFVNGQKGTALRAVEKATGTFCFIEGSREDPHRDPKPLLIFGPPESRRMAEGRLLQRIDLKLTEGQEDSDACEDELVDGLKPPREVGRRSRANTRASTVSTASTSSSGAMPLPGVVVAGAAPEVIARDCAGGTAPPPRATATVAQ